MHVDRRAFRLPRNEKIDPAAAMAYSRRAIKVKNTATVSHVESQEKSNLQDLVTTGNQME
jgi:hypothetical protein